MDLGLIAIVRRSFSKVDPLIMRNAYLADIAYRHFPIQTLIIFREREDNSIQENGKLPKL
jgi:hypothetical protein